MLRKQNKILFSFQNRYFAFLSTMYIWTARRKSLFYYKVLEMNLGMTSHLHLVCSIIMCMTFGIGPLFKILFVGISVFQVSRIYYYYYGCFFPQLCILWQLLFVSLGYNLVHINDEDAWLFKWMFLLRKRQIQRFYNIFFFHEN